MTFAPNPKARKQLQERQAVMSRLDERQVHFRYADSSNGGNDVPRNDFDEAVNLARDLMKTVAELYYKLSPTGSKPNCKAIVYQRRAGVPCNRKADFESDYCPSHRNFKLTNILPPVVIHGTTRVEGEITLNPGYVREIIADAKAKGLSSYTFMAEYQGVQMTVTGFSIEEMQRQLDEKDFVTIKFKQGL